MGQDVAFGCACGALRGTLHNITPSAGHQLQCHCDDCRRALIWLGHPDPGPDGLRYYQTSPSRVSFNAGQEHLKAFTWKNPRLLRWYADCCNTPVVNTLDSPKWAFASMLVATLDEPKALGTCRAHAFIRKKNGKTGHTGALGFMLGFARRIIGARLSGSWRKTPFFDASFAPIAPVQTLTHEDRATARH